MDSPISRKKRKPDEMRECVMYFRVTRRELDELYRFARARKATMSYMIREALREKYPDIFADINRHIQKPRAPKPTEKPSYILHSMVDGSVKVFDREPED